MAKPLSPKTKAIREAILAAPAKDNKDIAASLNAATPALRVKAADVAIQRRMVAVPSPPPAAAPANHHNNNNGGVADVVADVLGVAKRVGGVEELRRLLDVLAGR